jgi:hypothetical protein
MAGGQIAHYKDGTQCITYWYNSGGIKFILDSGDRVKAIKYDIMVLMLND